MRVNVRRLFSITAAVSAAAVLGCGGGGESMPMTDAVLEGSITYGGEPLKVGIVTVQGQATTSEGEITEDGRYRVENAPVGPVTVAVNTAIADSILTGRYMAESQGGQKKVKLPKAVNVPKKYQDHATSGFATTVTGGPNSYDIVIPR